MTDSVSQTKTSNSSTPTVGTPTNIGTITITPANAATSTNDNLHSVGWDGSVTSPMIIWSIRSGPSPSK